MPVASLGGFGGGIRDKLLSIDSYSPRPGCPSAGTTRRDVGRYREKQMKGTKAVQNSIDVSNLSIPDAEEIIEEALGELAFSQDPGLVRALRFLSPRGTRRSSSSAVRAAGASAATPPQRHGLLRKMKSASTSNASTNPLNGRSGRSARPASPLIMTTRTTASRA